MAQKTKQIQRPKGLNNLGVVITGLVFGANATAEDANEWGRWQQNQGNSGSEFNLRQGPGGPDFNNGSNSGGGGNNNPNDGSNNQNDPKIGGNFDNTIGNGNNGSGGPVASVDSDWVVFGSYSGPSFSNNGQEFTFEGTGEFTEGEAYGGRIELNLTDSTGQGTGRNTSTTLASDNVTVDFVDPMYSGFANGSSFSIPPANFGVANESEFLYFSEIQNDGNGNTTAAYGNFNTSGSINDNFYTPNTSSTDSRNYYFVTGQPASDAAMAAMSGVPSAIYSGYTYDFRDYVELDISFMDGSFTGSVGSAADGFGRTMSYNNQILKIDSGTVIGNEFNATSLSIDASNSSSPADYGGNVTPDSFFKGNFVGDANTAIGVIDVEVNGTGSFGGGDNRVTDVFSATNER